ncbi:metal-dependent protein hydrolase [Cylindrobasidium torrendii FP15055 ss-10]|uniref:Metal-dependent protein hydrolase n=1 Tax=Cylindrobasidium torrendii FP15055 ss-10 TaxID=1314674 RepID=A0A0D7BPS2_9AGAR|nr:metal-dependent protein hydrolase [Cylindrobasidium torrendii FP15055 ss-10]
MLRHAKVLFLPHRARPLSVFPIRKIMTDSPQLKKQKTENTKIIGTHNGTFHCDEALAVFLLRQTDTYANSELKRTRNEDILNGCDIVVDVGAIYDASKQRFDHHQRGFAEVFGHGFNTKLSSAGLIYKHFGKEIIATRLQLDESNEKVHTLWLKMYQEFIESLDAIDNGIPQYPSDIKPAYKSNTGLSSRVGALNPAWNQPSDAAILDERFAKASLLTGEEFLSKLDFYANAWLPARDLVVEALQKSKASLDPSGKLVLLEQYLPWKSHLFDLEAEGVIERTATYVVYSDESGKWRVQAVPVSEDSFDSRKALPAPWRGLRDEELSKATGVPGCIFIHASGFIGGHATKEGALKLAQMALEM